MSLTERIKVLDFLIQKDADAAFRILEELMAGGQQYATPAARPKWREDDAGAGHGVTYLENAQMLAAAKVRFLKLAESDVSRIAALLQNPLLRNKENLPLVLALVEPFKLSTAKDDDKEILRVALRTIIHWHRNYDQSLVTELDDWLRGAEACYEMLAPTALVARHCWLFNSHWLELPVREPGADIQVKIDGLSQARIEALTEIFEVMGMAGVHALIAESSEPSTVGATLAMTTLKNVHWSDWIAAEGAEFAFGLHMTWCISGFLCALPLNDSVEILTAVMLVGNEQGWDAAKQARLLNLGRAERKVWQLVSDSGPRIAQSYWESVRPDPCQDHDDLVYAMERFLEVQRPRAALQCCQYTRGCPDTELLYRALQQFLSGEEPDGPMLDSWRMGEILGQLEASNKIERKALIQLEFQLFPFLRFGQETKAVALYEGVTSDPALFTELICILYKRENEDNVEPVTDEVRSGAETAWHILHACQRQPGTDNSGVVDSVKFSEFIRGVRDRCRHEARLTMCDQTLGQILAYAPPDGDGTWPFSPAREVLEGFEMEEMRCGFAIGVFNKRGVTSRFPCDGGTQERDLAEFFRSQGERVQHTHPDVAAMLAGIARDYDRHGHREDVEADLRKEGF